MLNNLKVLKNIFALVFAFLVMSIIIRYNENLLLDMLNYINLSEALIKTIEEKSIIPLISSISMTINGLILFLIGFRINKLEKEITL